MTVDEERGIVYLPLGSATYDFYGADRLGSNLFANCLVALDAKTGERIWHFQTVHHDLWDYDLASAPQLLNVNKDGKKIDAVAIATKSGLVFVFDRVTGEPIFPIEEKPFPASEMPGEKSWPTQPIPTHVPFFNRHAVTKETLNPYFSEEVKQQWYKRLDSAKSGLFIPLSDKYESITMPACQADNRALTWVASRGMTNGRPLINTQTTGFPAAITASASSCWRPGRPKSVRECPSPLMPALSPKTRSTTSASWAAATAAAISTGVSSPIGQPATYVQAASGR
jgi:hypothetical protein